MVKRKINIALDGPSGSGKSTLAKNLARELGFVYIDTGALYRTVGLFVAEHGFEPDDAAGAVSVLGHTRISMRLIDGGGKVFLGTRLIGDEIRTPEISRYASDVSKVPEVREFLLETQRSIARENNVVMDGRDIGTVILPKAQVKIFVTASPEARAERRYKELAEKGEKVTYEEVLADMIWRDKNDSSREIAPCVPAKDAVVLDNSNIGIKETVDAALEIYRRKVKA
ncbi:MAG: (d)CMP kinase [Clostridia bacterium]|nr:(d)CMP kinase [Clostridia bacterium]MBR5746518.1 (d)CMP kinase [Clostridia bacterium]